MSQKLSYQSHAYSELLKNAAPTSADEFTVDLGYSVYRGFHNSTTGLNVWNGIRFAADVGAQNRWQPPRVPQVDRASTKPATDYGSNCPQTMNSFDTPGATGITGDEDCLFLNVAAPSDGTNLPVLVWLHGGGYGMGYGALDMATIINTNRNQFIGVAIQYRLGAFGFLSSEDVMQQGVVNAGILDQILALQWVQAYISRFGGDPSRVTIAGESAGAGAVMLLGMAYGGSLNSSLFSGGISASPYVPTQHYYNSSYPSYQYQKFAQHANCPTYTNETFACLVGSSTETLQNANSYVSTATTFGAWAFVPVTDGVLIQDHPAIQLVSEKINGVNVLTGNNAIEGFSFVPTKITTEGELRTYLKAVYPRLDDTDINTILEMNPSSEQTDSSSSELFATNGVNGPTATNQSSLATGQQQRAYNIYAEATFVCPSYWLAQAYSNSSEHAGYKYQYSIVPGTHGSDVTSYLWPPSRQHPADFALAISNSFGNFISTSNPSISISTAQGISTTNNSRQSTELLPWGTFNDNITTTTTTITAGPNNYVSVRYPMMNFNTSYLRGMRPQITSSLGTLRVSYPSSADTRNNISIVDGWNWEGGRGHRCEIWRQLTVKAAGNQTDILNQTLFPLEPLNNSLDRDVKIGVGVGVGLGVPFVLLILGCVWWFKKRFSHQKSSTASLDHSSASNPNPDTSSDKELRDHGSISI